MKKKIQKNILIWNFIIGLASCAMGPCKKEMNAQSKNPLEHFILESKKKEAEEIMEDQKTHPIYRVYVYKFDGTRQCEPEVLPEKLESIRNQLEKAHIKIFETKHMDGGFPVIAMCGAPTGKIYRFQIPKSDLQKALELGFQEWTPNQ